MKINNYATPECSLIQILPDFSDQPFVTIIQCHDFKTGKKEVRTSLSLDRFQNKYSVTELKELQDCIGKGIEVTKELETIISGREAQ